MAGLTYITRCKLCSQEFAHSKFSELLQRNAPYAGKIMQALSDHVKEKHPREFAESVAPGLALSGLLRLNHFDSQDESALKLRDFQRYQLFSMLQKNRVADEKIVEQVSNLELPDEFVQRVISAMRLMRDILEEKGQFTPRMPEDISPASKSASPASHVPV